MHTPPDLLLLRMYTHIPAIQPCYMRDATSILSHVRCP